MDKEKKIDQEWDKFYEYEQKQWDRLEELTLKQKLDNILHDLQN